MSGRKRWFWGTSFILGAGLLVASRLNWLPYRFNFWQLIWAIILVAIVVYNVAHRQVAGSVFGLAFLAILFARPLGIVSLVPWTILGAALLMTVGLSLIFKPRWQYTFRYDFKDHRHGGQRAEKVTTDESVTEVRVNMGNSIRYLQSQNFKRAEVWVHMGTVKLYFDDVRLASEGAVIDVDASLSGVELYLPRDWRVNLAVDPDLGGVEEKGIHQPGDGPLVTIGGRLSLSGLTVIYV